MFMQRLRNELFSRPAFAQHKHSCIVVRDLLDEFDDACHGAVRTVNNTIKILRSAASCSLLSGIDRFEIFGLRLKLYNFILVLSYLIQQDRSSIPSMLFV